ncbi:MAG TPA: PIG-L family deacetylase, partial [Chitinophagaceae bacterium]
VYDKKIADLDAHVSQMYEWLPWIGHYSEEVPQGKEDRIKWLAKRTARPIKPEARASLEKWYGKERAGKVQYVEAFEICEYGAQPSDTELRVLFPMLGK